MSISQLFPEEGPTLNLNFAGSRTLDPRITFTRTSTGTYTDADGLIKVAPANSPRFDHRYVNGEIESLGLLIEEQRTNLTKNSGTLSDYGNQRVSNNTISTGGPFGTGYHEKTITEVGGQYNFHSNNQISITSGQTITFSIFFKNINIDANQIYLRFWTGTGRAWTTQRQVRYNLTNLTTSVSTGTIVNSSIQPFPDDWYRLSMTATADQDGFTADSFLTSGNSIGEKYQLMGAQVEVGTFPTSYIPTSGSTATRTADFARITGTNFSSWYNPTEWTLMIAARRNYSGNFLGYPNLARINDGTVNNNIGFYGALGSTQFTNYGVNSGGVNQTPYVAINVPTTSQFKMIQALKENDSTFGGNGTLTTTDTSVLMPVGVNQLLIGSDGGNGRWGGTISQLLYYPTRLPNSQLQTLTK